MSKLQFSARTLVACAEARTCIWETHLTEVVNPRRKKNIRKKTLQCGKK